MASKGTLVVRILGDSKPLEDSLGDATKKLSGWAKGAVGIFAGLGVAAGAVLVSEFGDALARGKMQDKLAAQLNLTEPEAKKAGKIAGDLYADAYGDSLEQVHDAVGAVMSSFDDLDDGAVEELTAKALDLAAAFDVDVNESVNAAGVLMRQGLARDADHAFDLIVRAMQSVPQSMRGELIPIIEEYSQDFAALGIVGEDAFGLLVEAAADGRFELDKTGDALKEFTIRSTDMSKASVDAYKTIGLSAEEMAGQILAGGDTARGAFDQIVEGLLNIEDPAERANTAIALFGTPIEDLSVTEIPEFLRRLADMDSSLGDVEGAATEMGDTLNDNVATKIESFKRKAGAALETWLADNVLPVASQVMDAFEEGGVGGAIDKAIELWEEAQPRVNKWWTGTFMPWWTDTAVPWMKFIGAELGIALANGLLEALVNVVPKVQQGLWNFLAKLDPTGALGNAAGLLSLGVDQLPDNVSVPNIPNPVARPGGTSGGTSGGGGGLVRLHTGGEVLASFRRSAGDRPDERTIRAQVGETVLARGSSGGGSEIHFHSHFHGPVIGDKRQITALIQEQFRDYARRNGRSGLATT